jgi:lysozyme
MKVKMTPAIRNRIFAALMAAGASGPVAYVASNHTVDSEGMYTQPYLDPVGLQTVCVGHLVTKNEVVKKQYTLEECIDMYVKDWIKHTKQVDRVVKVPYRSEWMHAASIDFTFHMGIGSVTSSTYIKLLNAGKYDEACEQLTRWVYGRVNGVMVKMPGLVIRATERYKYCMGTVPGDYKTVFETWEANK